MRAGGPARVIPGSAHQSKRSPMARKKTGPIHCYGELARGYCSFWPLLLADERAVDVDVVDHDHACARLRSIIENKVNALDLASGCNRRAGLRRLCRIEAKTSPSCSGCWLSCARAAANFVNDIIGGDDHESRTLGRALAAGPDVVAEFANR